MNESRIVIAEDEESIRFVLIRALDGKVVMKGTGFGESEWRTGKGVMLKLFHQILLKALGPPAP